MFLELDVVSGTIVVSRRAASGNAWERQFTRSAHQFQCDQGVVEFPKLVNHGYSEAGMLNYQERVILAPRSDGTGLFFVRSYGPYKGYANEPSAGFRHEFYFYRRVERSTGWH